MIEKRSIQHSPLIRNYRQSIFEMNHHGDLVKEYEILHLRAE